MNYPIIDAHAHIYPEKIAYKAAQSISDFYDAASAWHGLIPELLESGSAIGVERYVVHSTATRSAQVESINDYIIGEVLKEKRFIGFGTMFPGFEGFEAELERIKNAGLKGIKLHPDFQKFRADDDEMDPVYAKIAQLGLPVLIHAGDCRYDFSGPKRIAHVLDKHPSIILIAAHFGGYTEWDDSMKYLAARDVYFDTSSTLWKLPVEKARRIIKKHGTDKFLFGSDFPMWDHIGEYNRFLSLGLTENENRAVLYENAKKLLQLQDI